MFGSGNSRIFFVCGNTKFENILKNLSKFSIKNIQHWQNKGDNKIPHYSVGDEIYISVSFIFTDARLYKTGKHAFFFLRNKNLIEHTVCTKN